MSIEKIHSLQDICAVFRAIVSLPLIIVFLPVFLLLLLAELICNRPFRND